MEKKNNRRKARKREKKVQGMRTPNVHNKRKQGVRMMTKQNGRQGNEKKRRVRGQNSKKGVYVFRRPEA